MSYALFDTPLIILEVKRVQSGPPLHRIGSSVLVIYLWNSGGPENRSLE